MILVRNVFQAKYARGDELVEHVKQSRPILAKYGLTMTRIFTDLTGRFFTVVAEAECESLGDLERESEAYGDPEFDRWFARMPELVDSGSRELFTVVDRRAGERGAKVVVERDVFQAKYGHGDDLIEVLKGGRSMFESRGLSDRILSDTTGAFGA